MDAWNDDNSYKSIDLRVENFKSHKILESDLIFSGGDITRWPSKKIPFELFLEQAKYIWKEYLAHTAHKQICMPAEVMTNTMHRLKYLHLYGHKVFDETILDPIKTLNADVLPRFLSSAEYKTMSLRLSELIPQPSKNDLDLKLPSKSICYAWDEEKVTVENLRNLTMIELFHDRFLYSEFLEYTKKIYSEENVLLARAIAIYKAIWFKQLPSTMTTRTPASSSKSNIQTLILQAENMAWLIFRFFICPQSCYECSISHLTRKQIMQDLADPTKDMFNSLEQSIQVVLRNLYTDFSYSKKFQSMPSLIKAAVSTKDGTSNLLTKIDFADVNCLGLSSDNSQKSRKHSRVNESLNFKV